MDSKPKHERPLTTRKCVRFPDELLEEMEPLIPYKQFSAWVLDACVDKLKAINKHTQRI